MATKLPGSRGAEKRWPLDLDLNDPEGVADFLLGLGYAHDKVVNALAERCKLDTFTAKRIVADVARNH